MARGKKSRRRAQASAPAPPPRPAAKPAEERPPLSPRTLGLTVVVLIVVGIGAFLAFGSGSGDEEEAAGAPESLRVPWVDPDGVSPIVGSVDVNPADDSLWMSTNTGLFRLPPGENEPQRVTGQLTTEVGSGEISEQLVIRFRGPDALFASGHPPPGSALPPALGMIESEDGGRTWTGISEVGSADFHAIQVARGALVAGSFGEQEVSISRNGGKSFEQRRPPLPLVDLEVDPDDSRRWIGSTPQSITASADEGRSWREREPTPNVRFSWPESDALFRVDPGGPVAFSADGGETWERRGDTGGEPQSLHAESPERLYAVLIDGTVKQSKDGGRTWTDRVAVPAS